MNCFRVQSLLSAYIDQELNAEDRRQLRTHIFNCPECSREMASLQAVKDIMGRLSAPEPPQNMLFLVRQALNGETIDSGSRSYFNSRHLVMTAACISLFLITSLVLFPNRNQDGTMRAAKPPQNLPSIASTPVDTTSNLRDRNHLNQNPNTFRNIQNSPILNGIPVSR